MDRNNKETVTLIFDGDKYPLSDYERGSWAYFQGYSLTSNHNPAWQEGWKNAHAVSGNG